MFWGFVTEWLLKVTGHTKTLLIVLDNWNFKYHDVAVLHVCRAYFTNYRDINEKQKPIHFLSSKIIFLIQPVVKSRKKEMVTFTLKDAKK